MKANTFSKQLENLVATRGIQYDLSRMSEALEQLGHPENRPGIIHVAGTNGKGTTCDYIAQLLESQGHTVGLYTSPHLMSYKERFRINGLPISDIALQAYLESLAPLIEHLQLTEFEVLTLIAWQYFKDEHPDFVVIETGLGGRLDATVVCTPLVTCITSISMDHIEILGPTLVDIAKEKAGIIKDGIPCYLLDQENEVLSVLQTIANERHVPLHIIPRSNHDYLQTNWALAAATVTSLLPLFSLPKQLPPRIGGRQQVLRSQPYILADAAHNLEGILALIKILKEKSFKGSIWYSATRRPELATIIDELYRITKDLVIFEFDHPRAAQKSDYPDDTFSPNKEKYVSLKDRKVFIRKALKEVSQQICVTGSIYFLGEMIPLLRE